MKSSWIDIPKTKKIDVLENIQKQIDEQRKIVIDKAKADSEHTPLGKKVFDSKSVEAHALEVALAEHKARELEKQLRELFVYSGQGDVYKSMMRARQKERQRRLQAARRQAEQKKFILDMFLIGSVMDYRKDKLASRFVFDNPNEKSTCGCGESFNI